MGRTFRAYHGAPSFGVRNKRIYLSASQFPPLAYRAGTWASLRRAPLATNEMILARRPARFPKYHHVRPHVFTNAHLGDLAFRWAEMISSAAM